jgi:release factor glutamine methyltransferase
MTIRELQIKGTALLKSPCASALIDTPALDAALLLAETLRLRREDLVVRANDEVAAPDCRKYQALLSKRRSGECIAYILGRKEFRGMEFAVKAKVLVPRPDTETLFEAALEYIDVSAVNNSHVLSTLDLCTGSGALAISMKKERPLLSVTASDISIEALETAALNAGRLLGESSVSFVNSDLFENLPDRYDIIISNPPYIPSGEISNLAPEVQLEPRLALDGGEDGLALIRRIIVEAPDHLLPEGVLLLEAGPAQMPRIKAFMEEHGFTGIRLHKDLAGRDRVISTGFTSL